MKKYNKLFAFLFLFSFVFYSFAPAFAIQDNLSKREQTLLSTINFDKWKEKQDPYLEDFILQAAANNLDIKTAALKIEEAKANVTLARANMLPSIGIAASPAIVKYPGLTSSEGSFALPMYASWEIDLFGKSWDKTKASKKLKEATIFMAESADISIISMVIATYYNIVNLDKIIELQEKLTSNRAEIYRLMKISNQEGLISTSDLSLAEKNYILAQNDLIQYKKSRQNALNALAVLIGDNPNNSENYKRINFDDLANKFNVPSEISSEIIVNRPDYKAVEKQLEASGLNVRAAKKEFLPTINIMGLIAFVASSASSMNWQNAIAFLGGNATLPIFTGFQRTAAIKLQKAKYEELLQGYQKTNLTAIQEVNDSLYNFKADNEKFLNNKKAYEIQAKDFKLAQGKFGAGVISKLDLLQQEETLLYIQKLLSQSKTDCLIDEITLYKATGARI